MTNHRGVKLCKANGRDIENRTENVQMLGNRESRVGRFTPFYTQPGLFGFFVNTDCRCCNPNACLKTKFIYLTFRMFRHTSSEATVGK